jgi:hypothetical protein
VVTLMRTAGEPTPQRGTGAAEATDAIRPTVAGALTFEEYVAAAEPRCCAEHLAAESHRLSGSSYPEMTVNRPAARRSASAGELPSSA